MEESPAPLKVTCSALDPGRSVIGRPPIIDILNAPDSVKVSSAASEIRTSPATTGPARVSRPSPEGMTAVGPEAIRAGTSNVDPMGISFAFCLNLALSAGSLPPLAGSLMRSLQMGLVQFYALAMVLGAIVLILARIALANW